MRHPRAAPSLLWLANLCLAQSLGPVMPTFLPGQSGSPPSGHSPISIFTTLVTEYTTWVEPEPTATSVVVTCLPGTTCDPSPIKTFTGSITTFTTEITTWIEPEPTVTCLPGYDCSAHPGHTFTVSITTFTTEITTWVEPEPTAASVRITCLPGYDCSAHPSHTFPGSIIVVTTVITTWDGAEPTATLTTKDISAAPTSFQVITVTRGALTETFTVVAPTTIPIGGHYTTVSSAYSTPDPVPTTFLTVGKRQA
jgi:hypothetical protein